MRLVSRKPSETKAAGRKLGKLLSPGSTVYLYGELGSGKTVFVKGMAGAFGIPEKEIASASFVLIAEHEGRLRGRKIPFYHIDLYRLESAREAEAIGIEDYIDSDGVAVVEWADRLSRPEEGAREAREALEALRVRINIVSGEEREIIIEGNIKGNEECDEKDRHSNKRGHTGGR